MTAILYKRTVVALRAVIRWLSELSCSTFENTFQRASFEKYS